MTAGSRLIPATGLPLLYFAFAHVCLGLALAALVIRPDLPGGYFHHPRMLAIVHLLTLGWITSSILGGDLNTWASTEPTIELLKDVFDTPIGEDPRDTLPGVGRIDYLLARLPSGWSMTSRRLESRYGSDHYPVLGILTLPEDTRP